MICSVQLIVWKQYRSPKRERQQEGRSLQTFQAISRRIVKSEKADIVQLAEPDYADIGYTL